MRPESVALHRTGSHNRGVEDMPDIEVTVAAVHRKVIRIQERWSCYVTREIAIADAMRPGVVSQERQAVAGALLYRDERCIVVRISAGIHKIKTSIVFALIGID